MVPFWIPTIIPHRIFRVPKKDHNFDNHPYVPINLETVNPVLASRAALLEGVSQARDGWTLQELRV